MSTPEPRFVIVPQHSRKRISAYVVVGLWLLSLLAMWHVAVRFAAPKMQRLTLDTAVLREERNDLRSEVERLEGVLAIAQRSDQVTRGASKDLQATLLEREEEIAALRADVGFYERLVSGSAQRQGLTVHSVEMVPEAAGGVKFAVTLVQSVKKSGLTRGEVALYVEGSLDGRLTELAWAALRQDADATPLTFEFRYFQQIEGNIMLPPGFVPQRVRVVARSDGKPTERIYTWAETQPAHKGT